MICLNKIRYLVKITIFAAAVAALCFCIEGCGRSGNFEPAVQSEFKRAEKFLAAGNIRDAEKRLHSAIGITKHKTDAYFAAINMLEGAKPRLGMAVDRICADFMEELIEASEDGMLDRRLSEGERKRLMIACGEIRYLTGDSKKSFDMFEKAIKLWPDDAEIANYLGYFYAEKGVNLQRALALTKMAVAKEPRNAAFVDSLGWVYFKLGRSREAIEMLRRSVRLQPADGTVRLHLGLAYLKAGRKEEARIELEKAKVLGDASVRIQADQELRKLSQSNTTNPVLSY